MRVGFKRYKVSIKMKFTAEDTSVAQKGLELRSPFFAKVELHPYRKAVASANSSKNIVQPSTNPLLKFISYKVDTAR